MRLGFAVLHRYQRSAWKNVCQFYLTAALLERFYDVDAGSVSIDGVDLRTLDPKWLRGRAIGYINQEPVLFATSIMENIRFGRPGATDQEVMEAAKAANADNFIRSFPSGYDTVLGERSLRLNFRKGACIK